MCGRVVSEDRFLILHCLAKYITQKMCDKAVDDSLASLKRIPARLVTSRMIKELFTALFAEENVLNFNEDSGNIFSCNKMGILNIDLNTINLDHNSDEKDGPVIINHIRLLAWYIKFEKHKALKKR